MHGLPKQADARCHDLIGVGFGPSNLALAVALRETGREAGRDGGLSCRFLEKQDCFVWHGNMLLDGSRMQISFLKDLVSLRDPTSPYSFLNYLHHHGRLQNFINLRTFYPSRREFNDYLAWVAEAFRERCDYGQEVTAVEPVVEDGGVRLLRVHTRDRAGQRETRLTRNVVIGVGATPHVPDGFAALRGQPSVIHSSAYLEAVERLASAGRVAVVGLGQSAAEIFLDLHGRGVAVDLVARSSAMRPADSSPFANEVFDTDYTGYVFGLPEAERAALLREFHNTNYAVVDPDLIEAIYRIFYQQKVEGTERHRLLTRHEIRSAAVTDQGGGQGGGREGGREGVALELVGLDDGRRVTRRYGAVVLATGYRRHHHGDLLTPMAPWLTGEEPGRDYRLPAVPACRAGIYLQGCSEATHGLSDTLLSVLSARAHEIATALAGGRPDAARKNAAPLVSFH